MHFCPAMLKVNSNLGSLVVDEGSEEWLTHKDRGCVSNASTIPNEWGTTTSVCVINVPPWYTHTALTAMLIATGNERFVVDCMRFSMRGLRTCPWKITGASVDSLVGHLMRSTEGNSPVHLISPVEYTGRRTK